MLRWLFKTYEVNKTIKDLDKILSGELIPDQGLCVFILLSIKERNKIFRAWPKFSGDTAFPVPGENGDPPCKAYMKALWNDTLYDRSTQYGKDRYELAKFVRENI